MFFRNIYYFVNLERGHKFSVDLIEVDQGCQGRLKKIFEISTKKKDNNEMTSDNNSDLDQQIETLRKCEVIKESDVKVLCAKAREILGKGVIRLQACRVFGSN